MLRGRADRNLDNKLIKRTEEAMRKQNREFKQQSRITAEQRRQWELDRQRIVGSIITQPGWEGSLVKEHVRGSQYVVLKPGGVEVYASHRKSVQSTPGVSEGGWRVWEDR